MPASRRMPTYRRAARSETPSLSASRSAVMPGLPWTSSRASSARAVGLASVSPRLAYSGSRTSGMDSSVPGMTDTRRHDPARAAGRRHRGRDPDRLASSASDGRSPGSAAASTRPACRATTAASTMTLGGLLKHLALVEAIYFTLQAARPRPGCPVERRRLGQRGPGLGVALGRRRLAGGALRAVRRQRGPRPGEPRRGARRRRPGPADDSCRGDDGGTPSIRRTLVDIIEEYARHIGHADILREAVDGRVGEDPPQADPAGRRFSPQLGRGLKRRTSWGQPHASAILPAHILAASSSATSTTVSPPRNSLVST